MPLPIETGAPPATVTPGPTCDVETLCQRMQAGPCLLLDVRESHEYASGHVPGSANAPLRHLEKYVRNYDPTRPVYVMCESGTTSPAAVERLGLLGFEHIITVEGGLNAWKAARLPVRRRYC